MSDETSPSGSLFDIQKDQKPTNMDNELELIKREVTGFYHSLSNPTFRNVVEFYEKKPYEHIVQELGKTLEIEDVTDINDDVSFNYELSYKVCKWYLSLSMIGRYALLFRIDKQRYFELINEKNYVNKLEESIVGIVGKYSFKFLSTDILSQTIPIYFPNSDKDDATVVQCLFSEYLTI